VLQRQEDRFLNLFFHVPAQQATHNRQRTSLLYVPHEHVPASTRNMPMLCLMMPSMQQRSLSHVEYNSGCINPSGPHQACLQA
jgi:hypothetical protein